MDTLSSGESPVFSAGSSMIPSTDSPRSTVDVHDFLEECSDGEDDQNTIGASLSDYASDKRRDELHASRLGQDEVSLMLEKEELRAALMTVDDLQFGGFAMANRVRWQLWLCCTA